MEHELRKTAGTGQADAALLFESAQGKSRAPVRKWKENGVFLAEGNKLVSDLSSHFKCRLLVGTEQWIKSNNVHAEETVTVEKDDLSRASLLKTPQDVLAVFEMPAYHVSFDKPRNELCLALDDVQDPGNLGTILRTADAFSIPVVLANGCADPFGWKAVRASMGAVFRTPPIQADNEEILSYCRCNGLPLAVTALSAKAKDIRQAPVHRWAVVIGSEGHGVCPQFMENCKQSLIIPMSSRCESLNAASAAAIVLWQMRQGMEI